MNTADDVVSVYTEIEDERDHQRSLGYTELHDDAHDPTEFLGFINDQRLKASIRVLGPEDLRLLRARYVKIAAIAAAAVESIDRRDMRMLDAAIGGKR